MTAIILSISTLDYTSFMNESASGYETTESLSEDTSLSSHPAVSSSAAGNLSNAIDNALKRDTPQLAMSEDDVKMFSFIVQTFVNPILCVIGFASNSLGVGVLKKQARQQKLSVLWYIFALTIADIMYLGQGIINSIPRLAHAVGVFDANLSKYLMAHFRTGLAFCDLTFLHSARYIVIVMSFERLISVMKPLHVKDTWVAKFPLRTIIACIIFNALIALPMLLFATVITRQNGNTTEYIFMFKHFDEFMSHWWIVEVTFHSFIPMLFLVPINIAIPVQLYRASKLSIALSKDISHKQKKVTITVLAITILYIFLNIPFLVIKIIQYVNPDFNMQGRYRLYFWFFADLGRCLAYFNAANDFLVYFIVSNNYRAVFKAMYCKSCGGKPAIPRKYLTPARHALSSSKDKSTSSFTNVFSGQL